ncbi:WD40 repeat-like protein [Mollisia scopiformis]|uniref:WD40 repeat-like protein n=1 Tax=Mollisia scopiformis TaxID=149040 RepID=A0A194XVN1_MOLSC|nr:WD40 repeat-like protein [Mollisia scopiformis]KUJ24196.1 WD40 repeat-like protein [Mollisia scopiformis]
MASVLKRKRAPVEVPDTPKRAKSSENHPADFLQKPSGWDAAFRPPSKPTTNGEENHTLSNGQLASPEAEAIEYDRFITEKPVAKSKNALVEVSEQTRKKEKRPKQKKPRDQRTWRISGPIGGRMVNADPVFTADEEYFIVANRTTLHVYSTSNSLLTRSIKLNLHDRPGARIVAYCLSPTHPDHLWVSCSDGIVFSVNWTSGDGAGQHWITSSTGCNHMTAASMESAGRRRDVIFTTEVRKTGGFRITANELPLPPTLPSTRTIYTSPHRIEFLQTSQDGSVVVGVTGNKILLGRLRSTDYESVDKVRYEFRIFESIDAIKSLDMRVTIRRGADLEGLKKHNILKKTPVVDLVVGDVRGVIFLHEDLLAKLFVQSQDGSFSSGVSMAPRKLHWHRQAVQTVKWSQDGNYVISGGSETVLVLWQLETGKHQFLPHMSATIQNVVVAPRGNAYGIQLADNSAMILSTAELQPTANISGIQTCVIEAEDPVESIVSRVEDQAWGEPLLQRTPAIISPINPSRLLLGVGLTQDIRAQNPPVLSNPFLQTFDLASGHSISRQAMIRNNITNINTAPNAHRLSEPTIVLMKVSGDGHWLATVDEWCPPLRDLEYLKNHLNDAYLEQEHRREVYLKFWQWDVESQSWELVSRVDNAHLVDKASGQVGRILDLAVDPSALRFSTIGQDNVVRTWTPKSRKRDGVLVRGKNDKPLKNWTCEQSIPLGKADLESTTRSKLPTTGRVTFSEDGSILAAAIGNNENLLHLLDPESGAVRLTHTGLFENGVFGMEFLGQDLIILSEKLCIFDVVAEEMRLGIKTSDATQRLSTNQKRELMILAVDVNSRTFALAMPSLRKPAPEKKEQSLRDAHSELIVFHQDSREPRIKRSFDTLITAILPTVDSEGYLVLDAAAQIHTVLKKGAQAVTTMAQSTAALQLDVTPEEAAGDLLRLVEDVEEIEDEYQLPTPSVTQASDDDDENEVPVVTHQQLAQVFDIGPSFALPPMEEMFYQVAGLFSSKPLPQSVS